MLSLDDRPFFARANEKAETAEELRRHFEEDLQDPLGDKDRCAQVQA